MHSFAIILTLGTVGINDLTVSTLGSGGGVPQTLEIDTQLHLGDGVPLSFGGTSGDPDVWMDDNGTTWCFTTTDFDGGGTDSDLLCYTLGSNALTLGITSIDSTAASLDLDLVDNDPSALSINASGLAGMLVFDTTNSAEKISTGATLELGAALDANGNDILDGSGSLSLNDDVVVSGDLTVGGDTKLSTPADGDLLIANNGGTQGVVLGTADTDGALTLKNEAGTVGVNIVMGYRFIFFDGLPSASSPQVGYVNDQIRIRGAYGTQLLHLNDMATASRGLFEFGQGANVELTGTSGVQYGISLGNATVPFEVNQSGTAGYHALHIDVTETATGSGEKHLIDTAVGGSSKFSVDNSGNASFAGGLVTSVLEADLTAGACTAGTWQVDTGGATRELCRCNDAGTAYDCISVTTANGPTD